MNSFDKGINLSVALILAFGIGSCKSSSQKEPIQMVKSTSIETRKPTSTKLTPDRCFVQGYNQNDVNRLTDQFQIDVSSLDRNYNESLRNLSGKTADELNQSMLNLIQSSGRQVENLSKNYIDEYNRMVTDCPVNDPSSRSEVESDCICEIDDYPKEHQIFYRAGCALWSAQQRRCKSKAIVSKGFDYKLFASRARSTALNVGYVGHWGGSNQMKEYIEMNFETLLKSGMNLRIDNTACYPMDRPEQIENYLRTLQLPANSRVVIRGNQNLSVGKWDVFFLLRHANIWAQTELVSTGVRTYYPKCSDYIDGYCMTGIQTGTGAKCVEDGSTKLTHLRCCRKNLRTQNTDTSGISAPDSVWLKNPTVCE